MATTTKKRNQKVLDALKKGKGKHAAPVRKTTGSPAGKPDHQVVVARAGTGKTFMLMMGLAHTFGLMKEAEAAMGFKITPSDEQGAVWEGMAKGYKPRSILMAAFNKSIVVDFEAKYRWLIKALKALDVLLVFKTLHGFGNGACWKAYGKKADLNQNKVWDLIEEHTGEDIRRLREDDADKAFITATKALVDLCRQTLTDPTEAGMDELTGHFDIDLNGQRDRIYEAVPTIFGKCRELDFGMDFVDMIWLPVVNDLRVFHNDLIIVDEAQDMNRCQQQLALKGGRRVVIVGDPRQAIYGFAGADVDGIPRMKGLLDGHNGFGVKEYPLTETRRCCKAVVEEAKKLVPDFRAHPDNPQGEVIKMPWEAFIEKDVAEGDMVLCRTNSPLVGLCFQLLKKGMKANIQGRKIGDQLVNLVRKMKANTVPKLVSAIDDWYSAECKNIAARKHEDEAAQIALDDRRDCLMIFTEGAKSIQDVIDAITTMFAGRVCPECGKEFDETKVHCEHCADEDGEPIALVTPPGVNLSSCHKAKGLEAKRVRIIESALLPHPMAQTAWQQGQELNLKYVAITRAIQSLAWVGPMPKK